MGDAEDKIALMLTRTGQQMADYVAMEGADKFALEFEQGKGWRLKAWQDGKVYERSLASSEAMVVGTLVVFLAALTEEKR